MHQMKTTTFYKCCHCPSLWPLQVYLSLYNHNVFVLNVKEKIQSERWLDKRMDGQTGKWKDGQVDNG